MSIEEKIGDLFKEEGLSEDSSENLESQESPLEELTEILFSEVPEPDLESPGLENSESELQTKEISIIEQAISGAFEELPNEDASDSKSSEDIGSNDSKQVSGIEKRQFGRADLAEQKIELKFSNQFQFARQYIDNISLGGLFVRTKDKHKMGDLLPISFNLPAKDELPEKPFQLMGKVCRVTDAGVGLEFTNLDQETRKYLEDYVRSVLPKGVEVAAKAKQSTIDRLAQIREDKKKQIRNSRSRARNMAILAVLALTNLYLATESYQQLKIHSKATPSTIEVSGKTIKLNEVRSLQTDKTGKAFFILESGNRVQIKDANELPYYLRQSLQNLRNIQPAKPIRRSKNAGTRVNIHR